MKRTHFLICLMIIFILLTPILTQAATINVPTIEQPTIQAGIDASTDGDIVLLADGTYTGVGNYNIDFNGKSITVKSVNGPDVCIVDCDGLGRGFLAYNDETVTLDGLTITNADAGESVGGAAYVNYADLVFKDCIFDSNTGGAVYFGVETHFSFVSCTFNGNDAAYGGAVRANTSGAFVDCIFNGNNASGGSGGGAVFSHSGSGEATTFTNCTFTINKASSAEGGAVAVHDNSDFYNCVFTENSARNGGAVSSSDSSFSNCTFNRNTASENGGAVYLSNDNIFTNCSFTLNEANIQGGAIYCDIPLTPVDPITLKNCILWGNIAPEGSEIYEDEKSLIITYSNIQGGHTNTAEEIGNIDAAPLFVDAINDDLHLQETSPCIDTGTADGAPADDLDGNFRPVGSGYDMGAYEYQGPIIIDSFTANPTTGKPSLTVNFACSAHDDVNTITGYQWNFGDGNTDTTLTGTNQHTYTIPGTFTATCTVVNDNADQTTASTTIEVTNDIPIADAGSDQIIPGNSVELNGSNSSDPDGTISSWEWALTHIDNPAYNRTVSGEIVYLTGLEFGHYTVVLTITDNFGAQGTDEMFLCVAASDLKYTQTDYEQAQQVSYDSGHTAGYTEGYAAGQDNCSQCPIREDGAGNKFLDGPLSIEDNGLLTIQ